MCRKSIDRVGNPVKVSYNRNKGDCRYQNKADGQQNMGVGNFSAAKINAPVYEHPQQIKLRDGDPGGPGMGQLPVFCHSVISIC